MRNAFAKVYRSFEEFEREELRKLDSLSVSVDDMLDDWIIEELEFDQGSTGRSRRQAED